MDACIAALQGDDVLNETDGQIPCCITNHPGFQVVCLNKWSLRSASDKYKIKNGKKYQQTGRENKCVLICLV